MMIINILRITQDPVMKSQSSVSLIFYSEGDYIYYNLIDAVWEK